MTFMLREVRQAKKYNFDVESDDIVRYSITGAVGYLVQIGLLLWIFL